MKRYLDINLPILSQPQFCLAAGIDMTTANNWVAREILLPTQTGGPRIKGTRLYSVSRAYQGRILGELVRNKIPPSDAAKIAELATRDERIEHWARSLEANRPFRAAFMIVTWADDCYESQIIDGDKNGLPVFACLSRKRLASLLFIVVPLTSLFITVFKKCLAMLEER
jgi:hypothetical protein